MDSMAGHPGALSSRPLRDPASDSWYRKTALEAVPWNMRTSVFHSLLIPYSAFPLFICSLSNPTIFEYWLKLWELTSYGMSFHKIIKIKMRQVTTEAYAYMPFLLTNWMLPIFHRILTFWCCSGIRGSLPRSCLMEELFYLVAIMLLTLNIKQRRESSRYISKSWYFCFVVVVVVVVICFNILICSLK